MVDLPTPEELTAGHGPQLDALLTLLRSPERFHCWICSRRAGKTEAIVYALLLTALGQDNRSCIYTALTRGQAKESVWRTKWIPLLDRLEIKRKDNLTNQQTIFENGSSVVFGGLDDRKHIQTFLGSDIELFVCDESQSASSSLLRELFEVILAPALSDRGSGRFLFSGTIPQVAAGYFYDAAISGRWTVKRWNRFQNPHLVRQQEALEQTLRVSGLSRTDPIILRDWDGEMVFDPLATAFRYSREKNGYEGSPPTFLDRFAIGIDPGTRDRTAIELWGWSARTRDVWHVDEWVTERNAGTTWSEIAEHLARFKKECRGFLYPPRFDGGGSQMTVDTFGRDYGIPIVQAAQKIDLPGQVARFADLLGQRRAKIRIGSALEKDLQDARWDGDARQEGRYRWTSDCHPDAADAARYGLQVYVDHFREPPSKTPDLDPFEAKMRQLEEKAQHTPGNYFSARIRGTA